MKRNLRVSRTNFSSSFITGGSFITAGGFGYDFSMKQDRAFAGALRIQKASSVEQFIPLLSAVDFAQSIIFAHSRLAHNAKERTLRGYAEPGRHMLHLRKVLVA